MAYENLKGTIFELFENKNIAVDEDDKKNNILDIQFADKNIKKIKFSELDANFPKPELKRYIQITNKYIIANNECKYEYFDNEMVGDNDVLKEIRIVRFFKEKQKELLIFIFKNDKIKILYTGNRIKNYFYPNYYDYLINGLSNVSFSQEEERIKNNSNKVETRIGFFTKKTEAGTPVIDASISISDDEKENEKKINELFKNHYTEIYTFKLNSTKSSYETPNITYKDLKNIIVGYETDEKEIEVKKEDYWAEKIASNLDPVNLFYQAKEKVYYYEIEYKGKDKNEKDTVFRKYTHGDSDPLDYIKDEIKDNFITDEKEYIDTNLVFADYNVNVGKEIQSDNEIFKLTAIVRDENRGPEYIDGTDEDKDAKKRKKVYWEGGKIHYKPNGTTEEKTDSLQSDAGPGLISSGLLSDDPVFIEMIANYEGNLPYLYLCPVGALTYGCGHTQTANLGSGCPPDATVWAKVDSVFSQGSKTINGITYTPTKIEGHWRLKASRVPGYGSEKIENGRIINTRETFYINVLKNGFGLDLEKIFVEMEGKSQKEKEKTMYIVLKGDIALKEEKTYDWLVEHIVEEEYKSYYTGKKFADLVTAGDMGPATVFQFITKEQWKDLVNTMFQGHDSTFWGTIGGTSSSYSFVNRKKLSQNNGKSNYLVFCDIVKDLMLEYYNHPGNYKYIGYYSFRNKENRLRMSNHFTVNEEKRQRINQTYKTYAEQYIQQKKDEQKGRIDINTIVITAYAESTLTVKSIYKKDKFRIDNGKEALKDAALYGGAIPKAVCYVLPEVLEDLDEYFAEYSNGVLNGENSVDWEKEKSFMNKWSINYEGDKGDFEQFFVDVNKYYDFYSGMTPYVEVHFRDSSAGGKRWNVINSIDHPYIKSLQVVDKGVKKVSLQLFDKDFASYQFGILKPFDNISYDPATMGGTNRYAEAQSEAAKRTREVYSLDTLIKRALMMPEQAKEEGNKEKYGENPQEDLENGYLKISEYNKTLGPGNLKIRYGYCDDNMNYTPNKEELGKAEILVEENSTNSTIVNDAKKRTASQNKQNVQLNNKGVSNRTNRWWDVRDGTSETLYALDWNYKIEGGNLVSGNTKLCNSSGHVVAEADGRINVSDDAKQTTIGDKSTLKSYLQEYMIIGYKTTLANNGILYNIEGVEVKNVEVMRKRFLQRYAEVSTYPLEVLYVLMRIFNESEQGKIINNGVKLLYLNDDNQFNERPTDSFNMDFDFGSLNEQEIIDAKGKYKDVYWSNKLGIKFSDKFLKKISLNFGSEGALINYNDENEKPALYKSLDSLINEFCSACPTRKEYEDNNTVGYDKDGNEIKNEGYKSAQSLSWMATKSTDPNDTNVYIVLYYRKIRKLKTIRKYTWGPNNPNKSVVKRIQIQNNNEFALLSSVTTTNFDGQVLVSETLNNKENNDSKDAVVKNNIDGKKVIETYEKNGEGYLTTYASESGNSRDKIDKALKTSMYNGIIEILGDPALEFNLRIQPYMYPIYLDVLIPINDIYFNPVYKKEIDVYDEKFGSIKNYRYKSGNQKRHENSGFYVITGITHNFTSSGYTTTLEVSKYPGIENDVLTETTKKNNGIKS